MKNRRGMVFKNVLFYKTMQGYLWFEFLKHALIYLIFGSLELSSFFEAKQINVFETDQAISELLWIKLGYISMMQKQNSNQCFGSILEFYNSKKFPSKNQPEPHSWIAMDQTGLHFLGAQRKQQSMIWKHSRALSPKKFCSQKSTTTFILID